MELDMNITKKQAILLICLGFLLVIVMYVNLLIRPLFSTINENKTQVEDMETQYDNLVAQGEAYDANVASLDAWREANSAETEQLYPLSKVQKIDHFLTFVMDEIGVDVVSMSVDTTKEYYIDGEGNLVLEDPEVVATAEEEASAAASSSDDSSDTEASETAGYTETGEYRCDLTYTFTSDYASMRKIMNFVTNISFLSIDSFTCETEEIETPVDVTGDTAQEALAQISDNGEKLPDNYTYVIVISAYMYQDPTTQYAEAEDISDGDTQELEETQAAE